MQTSEEKLSKSMPDLLGAVVHASAALTLHLCGRHKLPAGEVTRLTTILERFLEALDALPTP